MNSLMQQVICSPNKPFLLLVRSAVVRSVVQLFTEHPRSVDESYLEHMRFAAGFSLKLLTAGLAALVHAFLPFLFERTASTMINEMHHRMHNRTR